METTLFKAPLREYKTKKAAEKMAKILVCETEIKLGNSFFDMYATKPVYQIFEKA